MKDRRSKLVRALVDDLERAERPTKWDAAFFTRLPPYPYGTRDAVFCWLWANHEQLDQLLHWKGTRVARIGWEGIVTMMREDGVIGSRCQPPNANSARRVWGRVCREIEERAARQSAVDSPAPK